MIDLFIKLTNDGRDALAQFFTGMTAAGKLSYFKLGEGGWSTSTLDTEVAGVGDGGVSYDGTLLFIPVIESTLTISEAGGQSVTDTPNSPYDGSGVLSGDGSGTINYKTGEWEVTWNAAVVSLDIINAQYRHWGALSDLKTYANVEGGPTGIAGNGGAGPYSAVMRFARPGIRIAQNTITVSDGGSTPQVLTDDGAGNLIGDGTGEVNYETGEINFIFTNAVPTVQTIQITYKYDGAPIQPIETLSDLISESDPDLYTFQKSFTIVPLDPTSGDIWEESTGRLRAKVRLEAWEGIDDGNGNPPSFFEGGLFLDNDVMLAHFTFTKSIKRGATEIELLIDEVL